MEIMARTSAVSFIGWSVGELKTFLHALGPPRGCRRTCPEGLYGEKTWVAIYAAAGGGWED
jgi:hypothetical protein